MMTLFGIWLATAVVLLLFFKGCSVVNRNEPPSRTGR